MVKNVTYHNPINQEEYTPLVTILETKIDTKQSTAIDSRQSPFVIDLTKAAFGGIYYPVPGTQWYLKKISNVWTLMARAPQQNPQLDPGFAPVAGDVYIGAEGKTHVVSELDVSGDIVTPGSVRLTDGTKQVNIGGSASTAAIAEKLAATTTDAMSLRVTTDTADRFTLNADGKEEWGPGGATPPDTNLYRSAVDTLATDDNILLTDNTKTVNIGSSGSSAKFAAKLATTGTVLTSARVTTDTVNRYQVDGNGRHDWGSGSGAVDANLYRNNVDELKTDDSLIVGINLTVLGKFILDSREQPRGYKLAVSGSPARTSTSASTAAGATSAVFTSWTSGTNSMTWVDGRLYRVIWSYQMADNINSSYSVAIASMASSATSTVLFSSTHTNPANGHLDISYCDVFYIKRTAGSNLTSGVGVTVQRYISGIAGTSSLDTSTITVEDAGLVADNADLAAISVAIS